MADSRQCAQCGAVFVPRREHARFCCVPCRVVWNRGHMGDPAAAASALQWSVTAMGEVAGRLAEVTVWDRPRAFAAIGEAVWWVTIVDATLVRHHPAVYDAVLAGRGGPGRQVVEVTLSGLRFVRNRIAREVDAGELVEPGVAGRGGRSPGRRSDGCLRAGGRGRWRGTGPTRPGSRATRSGRPSAGPRPS